jgi:hypothetical protein
MLLRYAFLAAAALSVAGIAEAQAQSPFPPVGQQASPFPPVGQPQQKPPCFDQFIPLRQEVDKRFEVAKAALERRAPASELCSLLTKFTDAEVSMIKYVEQNGPWCNFPPNLLDSMKSSHVKSQGYKKQACTAAASPPRPARPAEPTLSDAFGSPPLNKDTTRTGRGTFDSLSGNPLAR